VTDAAITELAPIIGVREACENLGAAQAGYYRRNRQSPTPPRPQPVPHRDRHQPRALSVEERQAILDQLHSPRFVDSAPAEVWATLLDEGVYLGSISTFYRLLDPPHCGGCARLARGKGKVRRGEARNGSAVRAVARRGTPAGPPRDPPAKVLVSAFVGPRATNFKITKGP
jgi:hypothetical protein